MLVGNLDKVLGQVVKGVTQAVKPETPAPVEKEPKGDSFAFSEKAAEPVATVAPVAAKPQAVAAAVPVAPPVVTRDEPVSREQPQVDLTEEARARAFAEKALATERMLNLVADLRPAEAQPADSAAQPEGASPTRIEMRA